MFDRFTERARKIFAMANQEAQRFNHEFVGPEHLLLGLVKEGSGVGANVLRNLSVDLTKVRTTIERLIKPGPDMVSMGRLPLTDTTKKVVETAIAEARGLNNNYVGSEHVLLGLIGAGGDIVIRVLHELGLTVEQVREEALNFLESPVSGDSRTETVKTQPSGKVQVCFKKIENGGEPYQVAFVEGQRDTCYGQGKTPGEAFLELILRHPEMFNVEVVKE